MSMLRTGMRYSSIPRFNEPGYTVRVHLELNPIPVCMHPAPGFVSGTGNSWQSALGTDSGYAADVLLHTPID
jgi:hypothetical protein